MKQIRVYDINYAPEMQPDDSPVGSDYRRVSTMLYTLGARGADTRYLNLHRDALTFMDSPAVQQIMRTDGMNGFPCMTADDEIVLTGRDPSPALCGIADYMTEMRKLRHPYDEGTAGRRGIEY